MKHLAFSVLLGAFSAILPLSAAERIVSAGGPITEVIYALGAEGNLVAVDTSSIYPEAATKLPQIGYQRSISAEGVLSLKPDMVVLASTAGPADALEQIRSTGVKVETIPESYTPDGAMERVVRLGGLLNKKAEAEALAGKMKAQFAEVQKQVASSDKHPKVIFLMAHGPGATLAAGKNTAADAMIALAGGKNVGTEFSGYKTLTPEALVALAPDIILTTTRTMNMVGKENLLKSVAGLDLTPAGKSGHIVCMDDLLLLGFGPRTGEALRLLVERFSHPETLASAQ